MNCLECQERLQRRLDREPAGAGPELEQHLVSCPECRQWHGAARRLEEGLRRVPVPPAPAGLTERIVARVLADQRARRRRRLVVVVTGAFALAASVLFMTLARSLWAPVQPTPSPEVVENLPAPDPISEAGQALAALPRRTADETVGTLRMLWPVVAAPPMEDPAELPPPFDPTARSLRDAGQGITTGLEPVTNSARRAFSLLLKEIPSMEPDEKSGL